MQQNEWDLPAQPGSLVSKHRSPWRWIIAGLVVVILAAASFVTPIPAFFAYLPGPVRNVEQLVSVDGAPTYSSEGRLLLTTVNVDTTVTFAEWVAIQVDPDKQIVLEEQVTGGGSLRDQLRQQRAAIRDSKERAIEVALTALGFAAPKGDGARVVSTLEGRPADGVLQKGDIIRMIDGGEVSTTCDVGRAIDRHAVGEVVDLTIRRNGTTKHVEVKTTSNPQDERSSFIGVAMQDVNRRFNPGLEVDFKTGRIAGPSAGLMFALALYDRLTSEDLTDGRSIAGTGTIDCDGGVGPIGGIQQKVAAAEREGADLFLAPQANAEEARRAGDDIEIVAISTFEDAVEYLQGLN